MAAGKEVILQLIISGNIYNFEADGDFELGDYLFHDTALIPSLNFMAIGLNSDGTKVYIPTTSGRDLCFSCAVAGTVPDNTSAVVEIFGTAIVGANAHECAEFAVDLILQEMGWY